jgi:glycosyltransferase involved in cell wall biosynthesis
MSRVDVIVPCYNYGRYLRQCAESILTQEGVDIRVIVIDDGSTDDSAEVATELARRDQRVEFRRHAANLGHIATYNEGLAWAEADYTLLLSADDLLTPGSLARATTAMASNPAVGLSYGRAIVLRTTEPHPVLPVPSCSTSCTVLSTSAFFEKSCSTCINPVPTPTAVVQTALLRRIGPYRTDLPHTADMELWLRCAAHGPVAVLHSDQAYYRWHGKNMQVGYVHTDLGDRHHRKAAFDAVFRDCGHLLADCARYRKKVEVVLAEDAFWAASAAFDKGERSACEQLLDVAEHILPSIRRHPSWRRLRWKRLIGPRCWGLVRPFVQRLRSQTNSGCRCDRPSKVDA